MGREVSMPVDGPENDMPVVPRLRTARCRMQNELVNGDASHHICYAATLCSQGAKTESKNASVQPSRLGPMQC